MDRRKAGSKPPSGDAKRRTWDRDLYRERARDRAIRRGTTPPAAADHDTANSGIAGVGDYGLVTENLHADAHRQINARINTLEMVSLNPAAADGRQPGFYCASCDFTLKDNLSYLDHLNSRRHLSTIGVMARMHRSTVAEVREKLNSISRARAAAREAAARETERLNALSTDADVSTSSQPSESLEERVARRQQEEMELKIMKRKRYRENKRLRHLEDE